MNGAVIVIDMLKDFIEGRLGSERARQILPNLKKFLEESRKIRLPVIYVCDSHLPPDPEMKLWGEHAMKDSEGAEVIEDLKSEEGDYILGKRSYSGFYETGLDPLLRSLGIDTVILTGIFTNICVQHTAADAFFRGYRIFVVEDCVNALSDEENRESLSYMERMYGVKLVRSEEILRIFGGRG